MSAENIPDAPYKFVWEDVWVDDKKARTYRLGKFGKELVEKIPLLASDSRVSDVLMRVMRLEDVVCAELLPFVKENMLAFITSHPNINTNALGQQFIHKGNLFKESVNIAAKDELVKEGAIESVKVGRGKPRLWRVKKEAGQK